MINSAIIRRCISYDEVWSDVTDKCRSLVSNAVLSYTLGLRHAFDADHISVRYQLVAI